MEAIGKDLGDKQAQKARGGIAALSAASGELRQTGAGNAGRAIRLEAFVSSMTRKVEPSPANHGTTVQLKADPARKVCRAPVERKTL